MFPETEQPTTKLTGKLTLRYQYRPFRFRCQQITQGFHLREIKLTMQKASSCKLSSCSETRPTLRSKVNNVFNDNYIPMEMQLNNIISRKRSGSSKPNH